MAVDTRETSRDGRWLALVPVGVAVVMFALVVPRATEPSDIPLPHVDRRVVDRIEHDDESRAATARRERLPADVLALGTAIRAMNAAQAKNDEAGITDAQRLLGESAAALATKPNVLQDIVTLRAVQAEQFLDALHAIERTGEETNDGQEIGAVSFWKHARNAGWLDGHHITIDESARRVMFKVVWNGLSGFDRAPELQPTVDEQRVLYTVYLTRPHPLEPERVGLEAERIGATTPEACAKARENEKRSTELWRLEKIRKLGTLDPEYPTSYAAGVALYRAGRYEGAVDAFRSWIDKHPDGALGLRARNHMRAAVAKVNGT